MSFFSNRRPRATEGAISAGQKKKKRKEEEEEKKKKGKRQGGKRGRERRGVENDHNGKIYRDKSKRV